MVAQPAEGPFHGGALRREGVVERLHVGRGFGQPAAQEPFHDHHRDALAAREPQAPVARLVVHVHEIVLDLDHVPVPVVEDIFKLFIRPVEGEALIADLPGLFHVVKELRRADGFEVFPLFPVDAVHQVKVDMVGLELAQLLVQQRFHARPVAHRLGGHFGGDGHAVAVAVPQGFARHDLRGLVQIHVSGVQIGHAAVDGPADQGDRFLLVDHAVAGGRAVKTHAAQPEGGGLDAQFAHGAVLHG